MGTTLEFFKKNRFLENNIFISSLSLIEDKDLFSDGYRRGGEKIKIGTHFFYPDNSRFFVYCMKQVVNHKDSLFCFSSYLDFGVKAEKGDILLRSCWFKDEYLDEVKDQYNVEESFLCGRYLSKHVYDFENIYDDILSLILSCLCLADTVVSYGIRIIE